MPRTREYRLPGCASAFAIAFASLVTACASEPPPTAHQINPASVRCGDVGGQFSVERNPDGAEYGVCQFGDDRQCEEWALFRGHCPIGGIRVFGYVTDASRFCAITGGRYAVAAGNATAERGICTLPDGTACDADAYYRGKCGR